MGLNNDPVETQTAILMVSINQNLTAAAQLTGSNFDIVFKAIYNLVKANHDLKLNYAALKNAFDAKTDNITGPYVYNDPRYYCVKAIYSGTLFNNFTMSVNALKRDNLAELCQFTLPYFKEQYKGDGRITSFVIYNNESDMHSNGKPIATCTVDSNGQVILKAA